MRTKSRAVSVVAITAAMILIATGCSGADSGGSPDNPSPESMIHNWNAPEPRVLGYEPDEDSILDATETLRERAPGLTEIRSAERTQYSSEIRKSPFTLVDTASVVVAVTTPGSVNVQNLEAVIDVAQTLFPSVAAVSVSFVVDKNDEAVDLSTIAEATQGRSWEQRSVSEFIFATNTKPVDNSQVPGAPEPRRAKKPSAQPEPEASYYGDEETELEPEEYQTDN